MSASDVPVAGEGAEAPRVVARRHTGRLAWVILIIAIGGWVIDALATNRAFEWRTFGQYVLSPSILAGISVTLELTGIAMLVALVLGTGIAVMRLSSNPIVMLAGWGYIWVFRSVPLLVQLIFWYNLGALYQHLTIGVPHGPSILNVSMNSLISPFSAAVLGIGLSEVAYAAEIIRGGIISVGRGQTEAALTLGMSGWQTLRLIILPQAVRVIIPAIGNEAITTLKSTSLVSVLTLSDLLYSAEKIYQVNFQVIPLLVVATAWYLVITSVLSVGQHFVERHYGRGFARTQRIHATRWRDRLAHKG